MKYALSLVALASISTFAAAQGTKEEKCDNASFAKMASCGNISEVKMGKCAEGAATNSQVKVFAAKMVKDHTKAQEELKQACKTSKIECPSEQTKEGKAACEKCERAKDSKDFDSVYIATQIECHEKALKLYQRAAKECESEALKAYATQTIPAIQEHLSMAKRIQGQLSGKTSR